VEDARAALATRASVDGALPEVIGSGELSLPVDSAAASAAAVRSLDRIGVGIAGLEVRTPTLDDVFLALTGRHVEREAVRP
jgi:hypothetical protein